MSLAGGQDPAGHARVAPRQTDGFEDKYRFVRYVEQLEGKTILGLDRQDRQLMTGAAADPAVTRPAGS